MTPELPPTQDLDRVAAMLRDADRIVAFTGAGISTDSGIPDFRGPKGLWRQNPLAEKTSTLSHYLGDPEVRKVAWEGRNRTFDGRALPNAGHHALVAIDRVGKLSAVVTQNVDGLHQDSGIADHKVWELHGTIKFGRCWGCDDRRPMAEFIARVRAGDPDPHCELCGGIVKSDAVLFEQALDQEVLNSSYAAAEECDVLLAIGSTLGVIPAAYVVDRAKASGKTVVIINGGPTERDYLASVFLKGDISSILTELVSRAEFPT
jgi:NAD-dependent deacetylase